MPLLTLVATVTLTHLILFGPSMVGDKILLPLDLLTLPTWYIPPVPRALEQKVYTYLVSDLVTQGYPWARFAVEEIRAGRVPLWNPYIYCGSPFLATNNTEVFSPYRLPYYLYDDPVMFAWMQWLKALVGALGTYAFLRRVLRIGAWPAVLGGNLFAISGFMVLWQGFPLASVFSWLPWMLYAIDRVVRRPGGWGAPATAALTLAALVSGHAATGGQVLVGAGLFFLFRLGHRYGRRRLLSKGCIGAVLAVSAGWVLGFTLSAPQSLPTAEYLQTSYRIATRAQGFVDTTPQGWEALPWFVLPFFDGSWIYESTMLWTSTNPLESTRAGYVGLLAMLVLAPMAFAARRRMAMNLFFVALAIFGAGQALGIPVLSWIYEQIPLRLLRNNRLVFLTGFAIICLASVGFHNLLLGRVRPKWAWAVPIAVLLSLAVWSWSRSVVLPEPYESWTTANLDDAAEITRVPEQFHDPVVNAQLRQWYVNNYVGGALLCLAAAGVWFGALRVARWKRSALALLGALVVAEVTWTHYDITAQSDRWLEFPSLPAIDAIKAGPPGRICGINAMVPCLNMPNHLREIRGYDGADPIRVVEVLRQTIHPQVRPSPSYAMTLLYFPLPSGITRMLNLRYVIGRGEPPPDAKLFFHGHDYWIIQLRAQPMLWVPRRVEVIADKQMMLETMGEETFDPAEVAYLPQAVGGVALDAGDGDAEITDQHTQLLKAKVTMRQPGLLVRSESWDPGWKVYVNGEQGEVLRANHMLQAVSLPAGQWDVEFRYEPDSFYRGMRIFMAAVVAWVVWMAAVWMQRRRRDRARCA